MQPEQQPCGLGACVNIVIVIRRRWGPIHPFQRDGLPALQHDIDLGGVPSPVLSCLPHAPPLAGLLACLPAPAIPDCNPLSALHVQSWLLSVRAGGRLRLKLMPFQRGLAQRFVPNRAGAPRAN